MLTSGGGWSSRRPQKLALYAPSVLESFTPEEPERHFREVFGRSGGSDTLNRLLHVDSEVFLPDDLMVKNDRMTMAHSLEARVPFTDPELTEYLARIPGKTKMPGFCRKHLMRAALKGSLPPEILSRRKIGLEMPYSRWLTADLKDLLLDYLAPARVAETGLFRPEPIQGFVEEHLAMRHDHGRALWQAAREAGASTLLDTTVQRVWTKGGEIGVQAVSHSAEGDPGSGNTRDLTCDHLWSTIPIAALARLLEPAPPPHVLESAAQLRQRAMLLVYLVLEEDRFTEFDAHYFPSLDLPFTRVSEPKNYSGRTEPEGRTVLCAEVPCSPEDPIWGLDEDALISRVLAGLEEARLPVRSPVLGTAVRRLPAAYPVYHRGYDVHLRRLER